MLTAREIIQTLQLQPHPEGGYFRETYRDLPGDADVRAHSTAIYYLLPAGQISHWHRVDAAEVWHWYQGAPLQLDQWSGTGPVAIDVLGNDILAGQRPQIVVPPHAWQSARSLGDWTLVGCTVAPGFEFQHFELATDGWRPPAGD